MTSTVLITGAGRGLGFSLVRRFLMGRFTVFAGYYESSAELKALASEYPNMLFPLPLDVSDDASVQAAVKHVSAHTDALDIVINNAAIYPDEARGTLENANIDLAHQLYDVNTLGPLRVAQRFVPMLEQSSRRLLLNISSEAGSIADCWRDGEFAYCMSKAALNMQSRILHNALSPRGIKVLLIHPGWMQTDMGGPDATIDPMETADGIFTLALRSWQPEDEMYMDYTGKPMRW